MSNYNNEILEFIPEYINRIVDELNKTNNNGITDVDCGVTETVDTSISNYLNYNSDAYYLFTFKYKFNDQPFTFDLKVPKEVGGVFVVGGKVCIPYNELVTDFRLKLHKGELKIDGSRTVSRKNNQYLLRVKEGKEVYEYNLSDPSKYSEIPTKYLELSEELQKLAEAKIFYKPALIDTNMCFELFKYGEQQGNFSDITDITIRSTASYIKNRLNRDFYPFMNSIRYRFKGGNRWTVGMIYVGELNKAILKYFSTNQGKFNYFSNVTNPLTLQSLSTQVKVPHGNSLNASIFDVIDVVDTPINNNINKINYLNRNVKLDNGDIQIQVYDKSHQKVWLKKLDYCTNYVIISEAWDYKRWKLKDEFKDKEIPVKLGKYQTYVGDLDEADYIELDPNERTSVTTHVIPMVNKSELGRMAMGTSMVKQGENLINAEEPMVTTEDLSELIKLNPLIITSDIDGEVVSVTRTNVHVKGEGTDKTYNIPLALQSYTGNLVPFIPVVQSGQKVKKGEILISPSNLSENSVKYGINAIAAFNTYFGYNSDDSVVISESFANRISSVYTYKQLISVKNVESIRFIMKPGNKINSGDVLIDYTVLHSKGKYGDMLNNEEVIENILHKTAMNNLVDAFLFEVNIKLGSQVQLTDESYDLIDNLNEDIDLGEFTDKIPLLPESNLTVNPNEIKIEFSFLMKRKAVEGDKLTNRYGNKGIIAKIVPDKDMITTEDGLVADICFSRESLPARKNISQIFELYLGQISKKIKELYYKSPEDKVRAVGVYNTLFKTEYSVSDFDELVSKKHDSAFSAKVGSYSDISADEVIDAINNLGVKVKQTAFIKGRKVAGDVLFGPMYIIKLQFLPENSLAVTTSKKLLGSIGPELGLGKYRGEGQKLGEMESTASAVNSPELLEYFKSLGGVNGNLYRLYFDFLDLGIDISGIATKAIEAKHEIPESKLTALQEKFNS